MSAFADDPAHFLRWLRAQGGAIAEHEGSALNNVFVPRRDYGLYIEDVFREAVAGGAAASDVTVLHKSAVEIRVGTPLVVGFDDGTALFLTMLSCASEIFRLRRPLNSDRSSWNCRALSEIHGTRHALPRSRPAIPC